MATVARLLVEIDSVTTGFQRGLRTVSLGLAAAAVGATKMALDYEDAFTKISAVTNASQKQVGQWKEEILGLAGRTAQSPQELAEALYFLASAGLKSSQIMPVLAASARASASGLGETADIARLTANVLNAYAGSGLKAARVTDILVAAVREGTAEPDEFADAMGRILPIASKAQVGFDEVSASLATLSNIGLDVNEGVTAMRGVLQTLLAPTQKAKDALKEMGITTDELRDSLSERGIIATLRMLDEAAGGNIDTMNAVIGNVRALTGAFGLTQQEAEKVDGAFRRISHAAGDAGKAFDETRKGPAFKMQKALAQLKVVAIRVGQDLLPVVIQIVKQVGRWVKAFGELDPATRKMIVKGALLAAALYPVSRIVGGLTRGIGGLGKAFGLSSRAAGAWAAALALVGVAGVKLHGYMNMDDEKAKEWNKTILSGKATLADYRAAVAKVSDGHVNLIDHLDGSAKVQQALEHTIEQVNRAYHNQVASVLKGSDAYAEWNTELRNSGPMTINQKANLAALLKVQDDYGVKLSDSSEFTLKAFLRTGDYRSALRLLRNSLKDVLGPLKNALTYTQQQAEAAGDAAQKNQRYAHWLSQIGNSVPSGGGGGGGGGGATFGGQRQHGGAVMPWVPYIVGEAGREMFVPDRAGTIVPNDQMGGVIVNHYGDNYGLEDFSRMVEQAFRRVVMKQAS